MSTGVILGLIILAALIGSSVYHFVKLDKQQKVSNVKEWLKLAVVEAEKALGGGTGQLKLRYVYDKFLERFPYLAKFISFETFSGYVDEALEQLKALLESNSKVSAYINSEN